MRITTSQCRRWTRPGPKATPRTSRSTRTAANAEETATMKLKPEASLTFGVATIVLVYGIYQHAMPTLVEHRVGQPGDVDAAAAEKAATWTALATVAGISLIARDATIAIMGGSATVALA